MGISDSKCVWDIIWLQDNKGFWDIYRKTYVNDYWIVLVFGNKIVLG